MGIYRGITLTSMAAKIYNLMLRNRIPPLKQFYVEMASDKVDLLVDEDLPLEEY